MGAFIQRMAADLDLIALDPPIDGFRNFIAAWLWRGPQATCLVDVGPAATADQLIGSLTGLGVDHLDYICLTHIHVDHAGAVGHLHRHFPTAPIICHPQGIRHLIDPEKLWQGTLKTLGATGRAYGPMLPVEASAFADDQQRERLPFDLLDTPGHSPHHFAIAAGDYLFAGEAGGVCLPIASGGLYLRPATPPRFFLETSLASIDRLLATGAASLCYGHFGMRRDGGAMLTKHREQLLFWNRTLSPAVSSGKTADDMTNINAWVDLMLDKDPLLAPFDELPPDVQARERSFLVNSVKGFVDYIVRQTS